jgi:hypothetical protein
VFIRWYASICSAQKYVHDTMEETLMAAFPKCSFIEVRELAKGHYAVIGFVFDGIPFSDTDAFNYAGNA